MPQISLVGDGHGGLEDYATLALWWTAESGIDYGSQIEASCLGSCGNNYTLSGSSVNGAIAYTKNVLFDGSNQSSLATTSRVNVSTSNFTIKHFKITNNNAFDNALNLAAANVFCEDVYIEDTSTSSNSYGAVQIRGTALNKGLRRFVINATCSQLVRTGFDHPCELTNGVGFGATSRGIVASGQNQLLTDVHFFDCNNNAFSGTFELELNTASDDTTADYTSYTSAELVDFAGGDYRTKSTSFLATAGVSGGVVGAYLESGGGGVTITTNYYRILMAGN